MTETPIHDALFLERAINDQEGRDLVQAIHDRNAYTFRAEPRLLADPLGMAYGRLMAELGLEP